MSSFSAVSGATAVEATTQPVRTAVHECLVLLPLKASASQNALGVPAPTWATGTLTGYEDASLAALAFEPRRITRRMMMLMMVPRPNRGA
jgi:hypothetical protein